MNKNVHHNEKIQCSLQEVQMYYYVRTFCTNLVKNIHYFKYEIDSTRPSVNIQG